MKDLTARDSKTIWHPYTAMQIFPEALGITSAKGSLLNAEDGRTLIDCSSSWWTNLHGHSHPYICEKVAEQIAKLDHVIFAGFTHEPAVELAEKLLHLIGKEQQRVFFSDNGSTTVEVALKMALQFWQNQGIKKQLVVALEDAYHGDTFGAMSASSRGAFNAAFKDLLFEVKFISKDRQGLQELKRIAAEKQTAAFIFEPLIQAAAGMRTYEASLLDEMLEIARLHSVISIADEVFTGFGRTGQLFAVHYLRSTPDIICVAKGLTGGVLPLGLTTCKAAIFESFLSSDRSKTLFHGHSYTANPVACSAALASLELLSKMECLKQIEWIACEQKRFTEKIANHPQVLQARSLGTIAAIEINKAACSRQNAYFYEHRDFCYNFCLERGVLVRPLGNVLPLVPPYCISESELAQVHEVVRTCLDQIPQ